MISIRTLTASAAVLTTAVTLWTTANAAPTPGTESERYMVTITNITKGQVFAPAFAVSHDASYSLFELGQPASPELAHQAEEGDPSLVKAAADANPGTFTSNTGTMLLAPGQSTTVTLAADSAHPYISVSGMLVTTNDGFFAIRSAMTPLGTSRQYAYAYDAGSEFNSEDCAFIPGPPCGLHVHDSAPAEGFVHVHAGIHGIKDIDAATYDWRGPVAEITIERMGS